MRLARTRSNAALEKGRLRAPRHSNHYSQPAQPRLICSASGETSFCHRTYGTPHPFGRRLDAIRPADVGTAVLTIEFALITGSPLNAQAFQGEAAQAPADVRELILPNPDGCAIENTAPKSPHSSIRLSVFARPLSCSVRAMVSAHLSCAVNPASPLQTLNRPSGRVSDSTSTSTLRASALPTRAGLGSETS